MSRCLRVVLCCMLATACADLDWCGVLTDAPTTKDDIERALRFPLSGNYACSTNNFIGQLDAMRVVSETLGRTATIFISDI